MTSPQIHWLIADLETVAQRVLSAQQAVAEMCYLRPSQYEASALAWGILSAARLHPVAANRAQHLATTAELLLLGHRTHSLVTPARTAAAPMALVLGGDALFAWAAVFATAVENVTVMQAFSTMLMILSEATLRLRLEPTSAGSERTLWGRVYAEGIQAAGQLCGAPRDEIAALRTYGEHLGHLAALRSGAVAHSPAEAWQKAAGALAALSPLAEGEARHQLRELVVELARWPISPPSLRQETTALRRFVG